MNYKSKRIVISMAAGAAVIAAYIIYALSGSAPAADDIKAWAVLMLIFIGIGVAVQIAAQIIFHVAFSIGIAVKDRECDDKTIEKIISSELAEDEMSRTVDLRSARVGYIFAGAGFVAALFALALDLSAVAALNIMLVSFFAASMAEGAAGVYLYERGIRRV